MEIKHRLIALPFARSVGDVLIVSSESRFLGGSIYYTNLKSAAHSVSKWFIGLTEFCTILGKKIRRKNFMTQYILSHVILSNVFG